MTIETLIDEMKAVKQDNQTLEISEVLRIFNIQAMRELNKSIGRLKK